MNQNSDFIRLESVNFFAILYNLFIAHEIRRHRQCQFVRHPRKKFPKKILTFCDIFLARLHHRVSHRNSSRHNLVHCFDLVLRYHNWNLSYINNCLYCRGRQSIVQTHCRRHQSWQQNSFQHCAFDTAPSVEYIDLPVQSIETFSNVKVCHSLEENQ